MCDVDETLPTYTESDDKINETLDLLIFAADIEKPILQWPSYNSEGWEPLNGTDVKLRARQQIVACFFNAVTNKRDEIVAALIEKKLVTPNTTNFGGLTPLLAAVDVGNARMLQELMDFGAIVNQYGSYKGQERTPLQVAAANGNLALVKLLMEVYGADDSLVAPDGELALHLAAKNKHRNVVDYLPLRRAGGFRRWKTQHATAMRRAKRAVSGIYLFCRILIFEIPKFFVWTIPKEVIVRPVKHGLKYSWKHRKEAAQWCKKQLGSLPQKAKVGLQKTWSGVKKMPGKIANMIQAIWKVIKKIPNAIKAVFVWLWKVIKAIPKAVGVLAWWLWLGVKVTGQRIYSIAERIASFIHTVFSFILNFFRGVTIQDVLNGFSSILRAIFVEIPKALWHWIAKFGDVSHKFMKTLFHGVGECIWWIGFALLWVVTYVPRKIGVILASMGNSILSAYHEFMVWVNPKR